MKRWRAGALAALLCAGCISLPDRQDLAEQTRGWLQNFDEARIAGLPAAALDAAAGDDPARRRFARRMAALETLLTEEPLSAGNRVQLLVDGPRTHDAQIAAIRAARHHVHLDIYILTDDQLGQRYAEALSERARAGVKVRFLYDSHGSMDAAPAYLEGMRRAGVQLHEFNTVSPLKDLRLWRINHRNHRKLLVVDGQVGFTGGINITDEYVSTSAASAGANSGSGSGTGSGAAPATAGKRGWRDTHIRVEGPAVAGFQRAFLETWEKLEGPVEKSARYYPKLAPRGSTLVRLVADDGADLIDVFTDPALGAASGKPRRERDPPEIYLSYLAALTEARSRIWISQSYFAPNRALAQALIEAARRGVDVRMLVPGESDIAIALQLSHSYYRPLLEAGVRIYEFQPSILHAKTAVVDGVWSTVGSANFDYRSFIHNDEANAIVLGRDFALEMEAMFQDDLNNAREIEPRQWAQRGWWKKLKEQAARLAVYWL